MKTGQKETKEMTTEILTPDFKCVVLTDKAINAKIAKLVQAVETTNSARLELYKIALANPEKSHYILEKLQTDHPDICLSLRTYFQKLSAFDDAPYFRSLLVNNVDSQETLLKICRICGGGARKRINDNAKYAKALDLITWPQLQEAIEVLGRKTALTADIAKDLNIPAVLKPLPESQKRGAYAPKTTKKTENTENTEIASNAKNRVPMALAIIMQEYKISESMKDALHDILCLIGGHSALQTAEIIQNAINAIEEAIC